MLMMICVMILILKRIIHPETYLWYGVCLELLAEILTLIAFVGKM